MNNNQRLKIKIPKKFEKEALEYDWNISWNFLSQAIRDIYKKNSSVLSFEELYRNVYNSILHKQGDKLYDGIKSIIQEHLENISNFEIQPAYKIIKALNKINITDIEIIKANSYYLQTLKNVWNEYILSTNMISHIMKYMDKVYTRQANKLQIYDISIVLFRDCIIKCQELAFGKCAITIILNQIHMERQGNTIDRSSIKSCINMFNSLPDKVNTTKTVFEVDLETYILLETREFYAKESKRLLKLSDANEYLIQCEKILEEEHNRANNYLPFETESKIKRIVEEEMILHNMGTIIKMESSGLFFMLDNEKIDDLNRLYNLFVNVDPNLIELRENIYSKITELGEIINSKVNDMLLLDKRENMEARGTLATYAFVWVNSIFLLKDKYNKILKLAFQGNKCIQNTISDAFSKNINTNPRSIEFISIFIDENLKKKNKIPKNDINIVLDKAITLFQYIKDKNIFEKYYKNYFAKRLLQSYSISNDTEKYMITKLRLEAGCKFTTKLEGMFKDIQLSKDITIEYKNMLKSNSLKIPFELNVAILTSTFWPITLNNNLACIYPQQIENGNSDLKVLLKSNTYKINVSTYSMMILLLFNNIEEGEFLSYKDIQIATSIPNQELTRNLESLICEKYKILIKHPNSQNVEISDKFLFNQSISFPKKKIKIIIITNDKTKRQEHESIIENVGESRKYQIEAAIIRIMKYHKTLDHNTLVEETIKHLSSYFIPDHSIIKRRIEALIEREYLERHDKNHETYNYLDLCKKQYFPAKHP
ncbi:hypothetical protein PNEG_02371 [Pneumocystis murina B123]|uniref:Cullin family profile domain-containing protein n=1 Tax=Pneumocystis murina (strain B123) TaxID=1069680 RepID=M7NL86_PNEMU|nr:hypothetical protein PNEG_02371 [Pneumocystis murina B123]EMR09428.1 hypothetical protein PNEG_02371 [Pneumocystis murina B123]